MRSPEFGVVSTSELRPDPSLPFVPCTSSQWMFMAPGTLCYAKVAQCWTSLALLAKLDQSRVSFARATRCSAFTPDTSFNLAAKVLGQCMQARPAFCCRSLWTGSCWKDDNVLHCWVMCHHRYMIQIFHQTAKLPSSSTSRHRSLVGLSSSW